MLWCFRCNKVKTADEFQDNRRHYQIKSRQGKVLSCNSCAHKWVMDNLTAVRFDFKNNNWIVHRFENKAEAFNFLEAEIYQRAFEKIFKDEDKQRRQERGSSSLLNNDTPNGDSHISNSCNN